MSDALIIKCLQNHILRNTSFVLATEHVCQHENNVVYKEFLNNLCDIVAITCGHTRIHRPIKTILKRNKVAEVYW